MVRQVTRRRLVLGGLALTVVIVIAAVVGWSRWQVAGGAAAWTTHVDQVRHLADYDGERLLFRTEAGFAVVSRTDGSVLSATDVTGAWDGGPLSLDQGSLAFVDGGVLVADAAGSGMGVISDDGEWTWTQQFDETATVVAMTDSRVVVRDHGNGRLVAHNTANGAEVWTRPIGDATVWNHPIFEGAISVGTVRSISMLAVEELAGTSSGPTTLEVISVDHGSVIATRELPDGGDSAVVIGPHDVLTTSRGSCEVHLLHNGEDVPVNWDGTDAPDQCQLVPPSRETVYLSAGDGVGSRVFVLDTTSGDVTEVLAADRTSGEPRLAGADRWIPVESDSDVVVYDSTTGEQTWRHAWNDDESRSVVEVLDVGEHAFLIRDVPTSWDTSVGGAGSLVIEARSPDGERLGAVYLDHGQGTEDARVLDNAEAVVVLSDGEVTMLR